MAKISTYEIDQAIALDDKWIGSDANANKQTKNFSLRKILEAINNNGYVDTGNAKFQYQWIEYVEPRRQGTISFEPKKTTTVPMNTITEMIFSKNQSAGVDIHTLYSDYVGSKVLLQHSEDQSNFAIYDWVAVEVSSFDPNFYEVTLSHVFGDGNLYHLKNYFISLLQYDTARSGDKTYIHTQGSALDVWTIEHNLGKYPSVSVVDSGGSVVYGNIDYIDNDSLTVTFAAPFGGKAYLN